MKTKKTKLKFISPMLAGTILSSLITGVTAVPDNSCDWANDPLPTVYYFDNTPVDESKYYEHLDEQYYDNSASAASIQATSSLPSSVDLSTSAYFPPIRSQGNMSSCNAFSITYYQFTYEANKLNGISSNSLSNVYSPKWTYYGTFAFNSALAGSFDADVYDFLVDHGALKWSDYPYSTSFDSSLPWPTDTELMRNALDTRVSEWVTYKIPFSGTPITSNTDSDLNAVKSVLSSGKVLRVGTNYDYESVTYNGKYINYRCRGDRGRGHSMIIVGYDDNITYDINGNGTIESGERGAFKLANSYGTSHGTNGYEWVMYDALNETTSVPGDWEQSCEGTRIAAFSFQNLSGLQSSNNWFVAMNVENKNPTFICEVNTTLNDGITYNPVLYKRLINDTNGQYDTYSPKLAQILENISVTRTVLFDYSPLFTSLPNDMSGYKWGVSIAESATEVSTVIINTAKLTDDRGYTIKNYTRDSNEIHKYYCDVNLFKGDVNYDGVLSNVDAQEVMNYIAEHDNLSDVQIYLADYNNDGLINMSDVSAILRAAG